MECYQTVVGLYKLWRLRKCWRNNRSLSVTEDIGTSISYERWAGMIFTCQYIKIWGFYNCIKITTFFFYGAVKFGR